MRVILAGQKSFGREALVAIENAGHDVVAIWSPPHPKDALTLATLKDPRWMPPSSRTPERVARLGADLFVAAHSHDFIGRASRQATRLGGIGYHPSLLPRHRGRDAVRWTVHMGDAVTGGSVYWLTDNVDGGPIAAQDWCFVPPSGSEGWPFQTQDERASWLWRERLFPMGVRLLLQTLADLEAGTIVEIPQEEWAATWEPSWERPPLHRPELPQIGGVNGFEHVTHKAAWEERLGGL